MGLSRVDDKSLDGGVILGPTRLIGDMERTSGIEVVVVLAGVVVAFDGVPLVRGMGLVVFPSLRVGERDLVCCLSGERILSLEPLVFDTRVDRRESMPIQLGIPFGLSDCLSILN